MYLGQCGFGRTMCTGVGGRSATVVGARCMQPVCFGGSICGQQTLCAVQMQEVQAAGGDILIVVDLLFCPSPAVLLSYYPAVLLSYIHGDILGTLHKHRQPDHGSTRAWLTATKAARLTTRAMRPRSGLLATQTHIHTHTHTHTLARPRP